MAVSSVLYGPCLYNLGNDQVLIWWETNTSEGAHAVDWWVSAMIPVLAPAQSLRLPDLDSGLERYVHSVKLSGLQPNVQHYFRIYGLNFLSSPYLFRTLRNDGQSVRLGVWGSNESYPAVTVPGLGATLSFLDAQGVVGYLGTGSYVGDGRVHGDWVSHWLGSVGSRLLTKGFSGCRGDTDGYSGMSRGMLPFHSPSAATFAVSIGSARIVALTSVNGARNGLRTNGSQRQWFLNEVSGDIWKAAAYRIILVHHPVRTVYWTGLCDYGTGGTDTDLLSNLLPLLKVSGADLVLHGHSRSYQRGAYPTTVPGGSHVVHHIVSAGGGAPAHTSRCWDWSPPQEPGILYDFAGYSAMVLDISSARLQVEAFDLRTQAVVDRVSLAPHTL